MVLAFWQPPRTRRVCSLGNQQETAVIIRLLPNSRDSYLLAPPVLVSNLLKILIVRSVQTREWWKGTETWRDENNSSHPLYYYCSLHLLIDVLFVFDWSMLYNESDVRATHITRLLGETVRPLMLRLDIVYAVISASRYIDLNIWMVVADWWPVIDVVLARCWR